MESTFDRIADELATRAYAVADDFLSAAEVDAILAAEDFQHTQRFQKAGIGKRQDLQINEAIRGDYIQWLDSKTASSATAVYLARLEHMMHFINRALFLSLKDYEVHLTMYPIGSFYKRHIDQFKKDDHRKLSVICYLNKDWSEGHGGHLQMYLSEGTVSILPLAGRLVCFRSDQIEHEVLPATRPRLSITGWILDQFSGLRHL